MIQTDLPLINIKNHQLLPVIQGGMGVGISAHKLAGTVANEGAVGTIASVELRRLHHDIMQETHRCRDHDTLFAGNLKALDREISAAKNISNGGFIAVNVMYAVKHHAELITQACKSGANAIIMGAGLPLNLPELTKGFDDIALIPILSEIRGIRAVLKRWMRKKRLPDAIIIEHPGFAGGHLGATKIEDIHDSRFDYDNVLHETRELFTKLGIEQDQIPLIAAGGITSHEQIKTLIKNGANGVQIGTPFAVTKEGDANIKFKQVLLDAVPDEIVTFLSCAGLPARAVLTPWLERYLKKEASLRKSAGTRKAACPRNLECLSHCGFKDGNPDAGQFCIETQLAAAQRGDVKRGLFFRGTEPLPFGKEIRSVHDLLVLLLTGEKIEKTVAA
ncbi:MAG: nitronate monooxygenase [Gammaproteobacteria bacterium]|nr:nitronate monooxygenase [Gammaproteobacteria bacterium]